MSEKVTEKIFFIHIQDTGTVFISIDYNLMHRKIITISLPPPVAFQSPYSVPLELIYRCP